MARVRVDVETTEPRLRSREDRAEETELRELRDEKASRENGVPKRPVLKAESSRVPKRPF